MWWLTFCLVAVVTYLLRYYYDSIRALYLMWNISGPTAIPFFGSAHLLINKSPAGLSYVMTNES